ncbi:hypothetical protein PanWU01x14_157440, partial [Parasponia andersonii]
WLHEGLQTGIVVGSTQFETQAKLDIELRPLSSTLRLSGGTLETQANCSTASLALS